MYLSKMTGYSTKRLAIGMFVSSFVSNFHDSKGIHRQDIT
jgi:hypothetical protein